MITLINAKKASDKTLYPFMIKKKKTQATSQRKKLPQNNKNHL